MSKYSKSPWGTIGNEIFDGDGEWIGEAAFIADTKLMAAAPELLECLKESLRCNPCEYQKEIESWDNANRLIKRLEENHEK